MRAEHRGLVRRRPGATRSVFRLAFLAVLGVVLAGTARAESSDPDETGRWVPSLALHSGVIWQDADGTLSSGTINPDAPGTPQEGSKIRPDVPGEDRMVTPFVGGSLELMTPAFAESPGRPRLFVHGDAAASFSFDRSIAGEGAPDDFALPDSFFLTQGDTIDEISVVGQGSRTRAEVQNVLVGAGAGIAFTLEVAGRPVRVKPSFEYLREEIEVKGVVNRAVANPDEGEPMTLDDFRLISLTADTTETFHGIGPGLEIEGDAARLGPLVLSVYASGKAWHFLGDLDVALSASNEFDETASWTFEKDRWAYGVGVGLRFRWLPE